MSDRTDNSKGCRKIPATCPKNIMTQYKSAYAVNRLI